MNNDSGEVSGPPAIIENGFEHAATNGSGKNTAQGGQQPATEAAKEEKKMNNHVEPGGEDGRSDSEAETVVMPGKEGSSSSVPKRAIKHEGSNPPKSQPDVSKDDPQQPSKDRNHANEGKLKRSNPLTETNNSSNLSSAKSSPERDQDLRPLSRANSESAQSKSKLSHDSDSHSRGSVSKRRKISGDEADDKLHKRRAKRERRSEERPVTESRKASNHRSDSPPRGPGRPRALSTQSSNPNSTQKRKKPPPLVVNSRSKKSDDSDSNDSGSPRTSTHPRRSAALEDAAMPKPHRKLRDKNGRTLLARACALEDVDAVVTRLKDRPEDLNEEDNAGNTPLQIAALEGNEEIVKVLIENGCKTDCMNSDKDTPLIDAVENGHLGVVRLLLKAGVNPRQVNAKGEEPTDLVDPDGDNGKEIKVVLDKARERYDRRRQSEDTRLPNTARESLSGRSPRESPSLHSGRSPPLQPTSRRRPARSEPSRNDLLWLNPTPERLREKAGMGDDEAVLHILEMKPMKDPEAVLAAAKGGHELCLSFLFAIGKADPDPQPLHGFKDGVNTPMLAAIGRDKPSVVKLILEQPGFDPTRRLFRKLTYHELAKERGASSWEEEYKMLKKAYDQHKERHGGKSPSGTHKSPQGREGKKALREKASSSPLRASQKSSSPSLAAKETLVRKKSIVEGKNGQMRKERERDVSEKGLESGKRHLKVPRQESREGSNAVSDREASPMGPANGDKKRSLSDAEKDAPKPRKRLVSGKDLKQDQERKRRNSLISVGSTSSNQEHVRTKSIKDHIPAKPKRDEKFETKTEMVSAKKRARRSDTPPESRSLGSPKQSDLKKTKRPRVNSDSGVQEKGLKQASVTGPARVANMGAAPPPSGSAPVAFMGSSGASQAKDAKASPTARESTTSPVASSKSMLPPDSKSSPRRIKTMPGQDRETVGKQDAASSSGQKVKKEDTGQELDLSSDAAQATKAGQDVTMTDADEVEKGQSAQDVEKTADEEESKRLQAQREREEAERLRKQREEEEALKQKQEEEALRRKQIQEAEAEAALLKKKQEEEEAARLKRQKEAEEEAERQRQKQAEEEAARLKKQREEQEEAARQRKKREDDLERQRLEKLQEEERKRREQLPRALCKAAELGPKATTPEEIRYWLPLYTVTHSQLDPDCPEELRDERWLTNIQAAPLLGLTDLDIPQFNTWPKRELTDLQRRSVWRVMRVKLTRFEVHPLDYRMSDEIAAVAENRTKYNALKHIFWMRVSDLLDIVPRYPHLSGVEMRRVPISLNQHTYSQESDEGQHSRVATSPFQSLQNHSEGDWANSPKDLPAQLINGIH